jgi:murein DD-endopeptidase MepM/ murein hydrolase activator NlpD
VNTLLLLAGGGVAAYFLLRDRLAQAATPPSTPAPPPLHTALPAPAPNPAPIAPQQTGRPPSRPPQISTSAPPSRTPAGATRPDGPVVPKTLRPLGGKWVWPVPRWEGRAPVISDGFGTPRPATGTSHAGVDIMFARISSDPFPVGSANGTKNFVMPSGWMAIAASDGVLWSAGHTPRGFAVVIDHGEIATFYTHLDTLFVPQLKPPAKGNKPDKVIPIKAGQPLGVIGGDPTVYPHLKHVHFELWLGGPADAVDPRPLMGAWQVFTPSDLAPFFPSLRNARRDGPRPDLVSVVAHHRAWPGERQR